MVVMWKAAVVLFLDEYCNKDGNDYGNDDGIDEDDDDDDVIEVHVSRLEIDFISYLVSKATLIKKF